MSRVARKRLQGFQPVLTKTGQFATGLKFWIKVVKGLYYICSETKALISSMVTEQLIHVFVFKCAKYWFSHESSQMISNINGLLRNATTRC